MSEYNPGFGMFETGYAYTSTGNLGVGYVLSLPETPSKMIQWAAIRTMTLAYLEPFLEDPGRVAAWAGDPDTIAWMEDWVAHAAGDDAITTSDPKELVLFLKNRMFAIHDAPALGSDFKSALPYILHIRTFLGLPPLSPEEYWQWADTNEDTVRTELSEALLAHNLRGIETWMGWNVVEPKAGKFNFSAYLRNAEIIKASGLDFIPILWMTVIPQWFLDDPRIVRSANLLTGAEIDALSIFAPSTMEVTDVFFAAAAAAFAERSAELGVDLIDAVRIGSPWETAEGGYPSGVFAGSVTPDIGAVEQGFWVGDKYARECFKAAMAVKYGTIGTLNTAWGRSYGDFSQLEYPIKENTAQPTLIAGANDRHLLDFILWYYQAYADQMREIARIAKTHFPTKPINFNTGYPYDRIIIGQDITGLAKMCAEENIVFRRPIGFMVPWLYVKFAATAARHYNPPQYASEPSSHNSPVYIVAQSLFEDLTTGVTWSFRYHSDFVTAANIGLLDEFNKIYNVLGGDGTYPIVEVALFYPTSAHYLEHWDTWYNRPFHMHEYGGWPTGLYDYAEPLRRMMDYDVVDERMVGDGFLGEYKYLIWPAGTVAEASTLQKAADWAAAGGTLLIAGIEKVRTVEGGRGVFGAIAAVAAVNGVRTFGSGKVIDITGSAADLPAVYPGYLSSKDIDGPILVSEFKDGVLVYNRTSEGLSKDIAGRDGTVISVTLEANEFKFIKL